MCGIPIVTNDMSDWLPPKHLKGIRQPQLRFRRSLFFGLVVSTNLLGISMMFDILRSLGINYLEIVVLVLFAVTFSWISISFWNAVIGFALIVLRWESRSLHRVGPKASAVPIASRTALVMPVHNENPERVMNGLVAVLKSLARTGYDTHFDLHLLSDTTDSTLADAEEAGWVTLLQVVGRSKGHHYRRRPLNIGRKAGNIAEFCAQWKSEYDFMIVLDADSIMAGSTLVELVRTMELNPQVGMIQTLPIPARCETLFGRLVQFAACLYSPMLATGQSFWQGDAANYWGHNAILRIRPFVEHCPLPVLSGNPPIGGAILSHDFVEAALMRRAGWAVYLLPSMIGSYEEVPPNISDYAQRDRRWSQGSLQHLRLLCTRGLHPLSRLHFLLGALGYIASLLWLFMLLASTTYIVLPSFGITTFVGGYPVVSEWPRLDQLLPLLSLTISLLFVPKLLGMILALSRHRRSFGGTVRLLLSALLEISFAVMIAPLMMMYHSRFVISVLLGHDIRWEPSKREATEVAWSEACRKSAGKTIFGLFWAGLTLYCSPIFFLWLTPIFTGLLLAAPLVRGTSSRSLGQWTRHLGLFLVPSETTPSPELQVSEERTVRLSRYLGRRDS